MKQFLPLAFAPSQRHPRGLSEPAFRWFQAGRRIRRGRPRFCTAVRPRARGHGSANSLRATGAESKILGSEAKGGSP